MAVTLIKILSDADDENRFGGKRRILYGWKRLAATYGLMSDSLHPNTYGHQDIYNTIISTIMP
jgi:hypothetical protein